MSALDLGAVNSKDQVSQGQGACSGGLDVRADGREGLACVLAPGHFSPTFLLSEELTAVCLPEQSPALS